MSVSNRDCRRNTVESTWPIVVRLELRLCECVRDRRVTILYHQKCASLHLSTPKLVICNGSDIGQVRSLLCGIGHQLPPRSAELRGSICKCRILSSGTRIRPEIGAASG